MENTKISKMYERLGGNYPAILKRLKSDEMIQSFLKDFLEDEEFFYLEKAMEAGDDRAAFASAHALKGVSLNMEFGFLSRSLIELTEALRYERKPNTEELYETVKKDYRETIRIIREETDI